ncbi:hypothetical protein C8Q70DRAFT_43703 [Cubamyces menziesii]|nr:hypothetical protein C8Q70DRAFT_43703 [Cubamyces menziesii]
MTTAIYRNAIQREHRALQPVSHAWPVASVSATLSAVVSPLLPMYTMRGRGPAPRRDRVHANVERYHALSYSIDHTASHMYKLEPDVTRSFFHLGPGLCSPSFPATTRTASTCNHHGDLHRTQERFSSSAAFSTNQQTLALMDLALPTPQPSLRVCERLEAGSWLPNCCRRDPGANANRAPADELALSNLQLELSTLPGGSCVRLHWPCQLAGLSGPRARMRRGNIDLKHG